MTKVSFYLNGRNVEGGNTLSYELTNKMALEVIELVNIVGEDQDVIAKIKYDAGEDGERIYHVLVDSVTTDPIEDLSEVEEEDTVVEIFTGNRFDIEGWNSLVEKEREAAEKRAATEAAWDSVNTNIDPIDAIRAYFDSYDMTADNGYRGSKYFKIYNLNRIGDAELVVTGENVDTIFRLKSKDFDNIEKVYEVLKAWNAYENFAYYVRELDERFQANGNTFEATYGVKDNTLIIKVGDVEYGTTFGFQTTQMVVGGISITLYTCSRVTVDGILEGIISALVRNVIENKGPTLFDVLK